jgi:predicted RNase H-like HicB family nuclease
MKEFTTIIGGAEDYYFAYCPDLPEAHAQGKTMEECSCGLAVAIASILRGEGSYTRGSI